LETLTGDDEFCARTKYLFKPPLVHSLTETPWHISARQGPDLTTIM